MVRPIASAAAPMLGAGSSSRGVVVSTIASSSVTWMNVSPWVRGMFGLTCAMTFFAARVAGLV